MRFVTVKTEEQQARAMLFRTRDLLVRQRTQPINALRGHLAEHGLVAPQGPANLKGLAEAIESQTPLPLLVVELSRVLLDPIDGLSKTIAELEKATVQEAARSDAAPPANPAGRGADHRDGDRDVRSADGRLPARPRLCRLAWALSPG